MPVTIQDRVYPWLNRHDLGKELGNVNANGSAATPSPRFPSVNQVYAIGSLFAHGARFVLGRVAGCVRRNDTTRSLRARVTPDLWAFLFLMVLGSPLAAQRQPMQTFDRVLWATSSVLIVVDWGQTHDAIERGHGESNPLLGSFPTHGALNRYMAGVLAANALVTRLNKREARRIVWALVIGAELNAAWHNKAIGLGWRFDF